jgi:dolichol-phosphate mannosyltransferase
VQPSFDAGGETVSVLVPTLNEGARLRPCLEGLARQGPELLEVIVVDSASTDDTADVVTAAAARDARIRLVSDPPLPDGWIGKVWALQHGLSHARGDWVLGVDADTEANPGLVGGVVAAARAHDLDLVSFSPTFAAQSAGERWLQPSLLVTLVYRFGAPVARPQRDRLLANGQCFLVRRSTLLAHGGYHAARASFADDVFLARHYAANGVACGFLDGSLLYRVRAYRSALEMWREWGRSVDLSDVVSGTRQAVDVITLVLVQALPAPILAAMALGGFPVWAPLVAMNGVLLAIRIGIGRAIARSYERRGWPFALSWLADPLAVLRIAMSAIRRPRRWRGREYHVVAR